jgi:hypothetical protein
MLGATPNWSLSSTRSRFANRPPVGETAQPAAREDVLPDAVHMALSSSDIIEAIIDQLIAGRLGGASESVDVKRTGPRSISLDYGSKGRFDLIVTPDDGLSDL